MGKALLGTFTTPRAAQLLDEVRALRARVQELEEALAEAEAAVDRRAKETEAARDSSDLRVVALDEAAVASR